MVIQKSFQNDNNTLFIIPTPIGNLEDITIRTLNTLKELEILFCEDTRVTRKLLNHFNIKCKLYSYHTHNESEASSQVLNLLQLQNVGLVSDAGMPLISDPGILLIDKVRNAGFNVITLPGASAFVIGAVESGFISKEFVFYGFLNKSTSKREIELNSIINSATPTIIYETPHKLMRTLEAIHNINPKQHILLAKEISKLFEEYVSGSISEVYDYYLEKKPKGEFLIVFKPNQHINHISNPIEYYNNLLDSGLKKKDAIKQVAKELNVSKNEIYQLVIKEENE